MRVLIVENGQALADGMRSLQACGWEHAINGRSALSEVMRYADMGESSEG